MVTASMSNRAGDETWKRERRAMVERQMAARGIQNQAVLEAMRNVPRHEFIGGDLQEFAYADTPLPIEQEQTISQPYIVALMTEALALEPEDKVLEIGTGSGYAAAVLAEVADEVYTVERHGNLAHIAREQFERLGYDNVHVRHGDGTEGWPEHAPYDGIVAAAGGPRIPEALKEQMAIGGRLVMPVGDLPRLQRLIRLRRVSQEEYVEEDMGYVQFVPLVGTAGWSEREAGSGPAAPAPAPKETVPELITGAAEPFADIVEANLAGFLDRVGDARVVLLGESTHGTAEFYQMRDRLTRALIAEKGFNVVALEADWPDAARLDAQVRPPRRDRDREGNGDFTPSSHFPSWMWANAEFENFVRWLQAYNEQAVHPETAPGIYGLDLYSLYQSIEAVLDYLEEVDPDTAAVARQRYGCLSPWEGDPSTYGLATLTGKYQECERQVISILQEMLDKHLQYALHDGERFFDAAQNARVIANAERYYRVMYYGSPHSWNLRDEHMFDTLKAVLAFRGPDSRAVVWAHNSHVGDATATEMSARGQHTLGQLCREEWGEEAYLVGLGTAQGEVIAADRWGASAEAVALRPPQPQSYEALCQAATPTRFFLPLRANREQAVGKALLKERLERAVGVVYRPETEVQSHYFRAALPRQFDEYVWFEQTSALTPLPASGEREGIPDTFPTGL